MLPYLPTRLRLSKRREGKNAREFLGSLAGLPLLHGRVVETVIEEASADPGRYVSRARFRHCIF